MNGKLIVIDGSDGSGKETQTRFLVNRLKGEGHKIKRVDFPRYKSPSSIGVRQYLAGTLGKPEDIGAKAASIFFALDRYSSVPDIKDCLAQGYTVVANRYVSANMGHQGSFMNTTEERKEFFEWLYDLEYNKLGIPKPDLNIILYCPTDVTKKLREERGRKTDILEMDEDHQLKSSQIFKEIATTFPDFTLIECLNDKEELKTREQLHEEIWEQVEEACAMI